jgi:large subunit ribosomal protein L22
MANTTLVKYTNKNVLISPRKIRLVVEAAKKLSPQKALDSLKFTNSSGARILVKCLKNVIADAKNNYNLDPSTLSFVEFTANEGMKLKRMDRAHGARFARGVIIKKHARINITLTGKAKMDLKSTEITNSPQDKSKDKSKDKKLKAKN